MRESVVYFREHLVLEPWGDAERGARSVPRRRPRRRRPAERRAACHRSAGTPAEPDEAAYCTACGTELAEDDEAAAAASAAPS